MKYKFKNIFLIIICSVNLISQTEHKLTVEDVFPKEYIRADRELCNIILMHIKFSINSDKDSNFYTDIDEDFIKKIKNSSKVFAYNSSIRYGYRAINKSFKLQWSSEFIGDGSNGKIFDAFDKHSFIKKKKDKENIYIDERGILLEWFWTLEDGLNTLLSIAMKKDYIDSFRKNTYDKKRDLVIALVVTQSNFFKDSVTQTKNIIDWESLSLINTSKKIKKVGDNIYSLNLDSYNDFHNSFYLNRKLEDKKSGDLELIYKSNFPLESISNILLSQNWFYKDTIEVNLKHKLYGHEEFTHKINLVALNKFLIEEHDPFIAVIDSAKNGDYYKVNEIFISKNKKNVHLIKYEIPKNNFFNQGKVLLNATLYSNIRLDNLAEINKEDVKKTPKMKLKL